MSGFYGHQALCSHRNQFEAAILYNRHQCLQNYNQSSNTGDTKHTLLFSVAMFHLVINLLLLQVSALADQQSKLSLINPSLINCNIIYSVYCFFLPTALIHDDTIDLSYPRESIEICFQAITDNLKLQCESPIAMNVISVAPATDFFKELASYKGSCNI